MTDIRKLLERQARWQRSLRDLPWPGKVRMAARARFRIEKLRRRPDNPPPRGHLAPPR